MFSKQARKPLVLLVFCFKMRKLKGFWRICCGCGQFGWAGPRWTWAPLPTTKNPCAGHFLHMSLALQGSPAGQPAWWRNCLRSQSRGTTPSRASSLVALLYHPRGICQVPVILSFRSLDEDGIKKLSTGGKTGKKERKSEKSEELPSEMW